MNTNSRRFESHVIAGGAGFLGSNLVRKLLRFQEVREIVVLDNYSSGSITNLDGVLDDPRLKVIETDISQKTPELNGNFNWIWHLAALANPTDYEKYPVDTLNVNSDGNKNLIWLAQKYQAGYIYFSSSEVYGLYNTIPSKGLNEKETISRLMLGKPRSPYAVGKCFGEELTQHLCRLYGIHYLIIRPFNIYGPYMDVKTNYGRVIPNFITWALQKEPLRINGDGTQIRTFCYIDDFVTAVLKIINHPSPVSVVNIGSPFPTPIRDLADVINGLLGNKTAPLFVERYPFEPYARIPDLRCIKQFTGWKPHIDLINGLNKTICWFKSKIKP